MAFNYIDDVDSTLSIINTNTNEEIILFGKVLNYTSTNNMKVNVIKDNLTKTNKFIKYVENNREPSTLDFTYVNAPAKTIMDLKSWFNNKADLSVTLVSGRDGESRLVFNPCVLATEPMAPTRASNFEATLMFTGGYIEEILVD